MVRFEVVHEIAAPVETVWAWWTDFGEVGQTFRVKHGAGSSTRTIVAREGDTITFYDKSVIGNVRRSVTINHVERMLHEVGTEGQTFESTWKFDAMGPARTRVTRTMRARASPIFRGFSRWLTKQDLAYHCREAEREITRAS